jgi:hypothetical protein
MSEAGMPMLQYPSETAGSTEGLDALVADHLAFSSPVLL